MELDSSKYKVSEGSTIVTLLKTYLETLSAGTYNMKILFSNLESVTSTFMINAKTINNPQTSDNIIIHIILGTLSLLGLSTILIYKKKIKRLNLY